MQSYYTTYIYLQRNKQEKQDTMNSKEDYNENRDDFSELYTQFRPCSGESFSQVTNCPFFAFLTMIFLDEEILLQPAKDIIYLKRV